MLFRSNVIAITGEARDAGMSVGNIPVPSLDAAKLALSAIANWKEDQQETVEPASDELSALQARFDRLAEEAQGLRRQISAAEAYAIRVAAFSDEVQRQDARLSLVSLFGEQRNSHVQCPLCSAALEGEGEVFAAVRMSADRLRTQLEAASRQRPRLQEHLEEMRARLNRVERDGDDVRGGIRAIYRSHSENRAYRESILRRARIAGRASEMLDGMQVDHDDARQKAHRHELEREIRRLAKDCDNDAIAARMRAIEIAISNRVATYANDMGLAHTDSPVTLDLKDLSLRFVVGMDTVGLERVGAGKNWVGYHVAAHLGLHSWLIEHSRPVPRLLFVDQVSQPFFANEKKNDPDRSEVDLRDDDRGEVMRVIKELHQFCATHSSQFQIILIEHIDSDEEWFAESVVARWRGSDAFIPSDWPILVE